MFLRNKWIIVKNSCTKLLARFSYRQKMMAIILIFTLIPVGLASSLVLAKIYNEKVENIEKTYQNYLSNSAEGVNNLFYINIERITYISLNNQVHGLLTSDFKDDIIEAIDKFSSIRDIFSAMQLNTSGVGINIFPLNGFPYRGDYIQNIDMLDQTIITDVMNADSQSIVWNIGAGNMEDENNKMFIYLYKTILTIEKPIAIIEIKIPFSKITEMFSFDLPANSFIVYMLDGGKHHIVKNNDVEMAEVDAAIGNYLKSGKSDEYNIVSAEVKSGRNRVIMFIGRDYVYSEFRSTAFLSIFALIMLILAIYTLVRFVSSSLTSRLTKVLQDMDTDLDKIIQENSGEIFTLKGDDEFGKINNKFTQMIYKIKEYYQKYTENETQKHALEMELLQANFNPHFLYNTLSTIKWTYTDKKLSDIIDSMVKYYRLVLNKGEKVYKASKEMELLKEYMDIQMFAYNIKFIYDFEVEPKVSEALILKNLLQPVVENAILHGINGMTGESRIEIKGTLTDETIVFEIRDNGRGMEQEKVNSILGENSNDSGLYGGYGIKNIISRVHAHYGNAYGIKINSTLKQGTQVIITVPYQII